MMEPQRNAEEQRRRELKAGKTKQNQNVNLKAKRNHGNKGPELKFVKILLLSVLCDLSGRKPKTGR
jgi:hypothetical protein